MFKKARFAVKTGPVFLIAIMLFISFLFLCFTCCVLKQTSAIGYSAVKVKQAEAGQQENTGLEKSASPDVESSEEKQHSVSSEQVTDIMFHNYDADFAFTYPQHILTLSSNPYVRKDFGDMLLSIEISEIENIETTDGYDKEAVKKDKEELENGNFGEIIDFVFEPSKRVVKILDTYVKDFIIFSRFDECNVTFERKAIFYNNNYQVIITLHGDVDKITESMADYFVRDDISCGGRIVWGSNKQQDFYEKIVSGQASKIAQTWYDTFDSVLELLQINYYKGASAGYSRIIDKRTYEKNEELKYTAVIAYPEFQSAVSGNLQDTINSYILNESVIPTKDDFIKSVEESGAIDDEQIFWQYYLQVDYSVLMFNDYAISVNQDIYNYMGGAHGISYFETFNYDIVNNKMLKLDDIFKPEYEYLVFLSDYCTKDIARQIRNTDTEPEEDWIREGTDPSVSENYSHFLITPDSLIIKFLSYQVAPGAAGDFSVKIPYDLIMDNINPDSIITEIIK